MCQKSIEFDRRIVRREHSQLRKASASRTIESRDVARIGNAGLASLMVASARSSAFVICSTRRHDAITYAAQR
jgi:hypothetical protein